MKNFMTENRIDAFLLGIGRLEMLCCDVITRSRPVKDMWHSLLFLNRSN